MSLIISLRIPDGIVVAADSLSISQTLVELAAQNVELICPKCQEKITGKELKLPPFGVPFSASSYTQKLFPLFEKFALGAVGLGIINGKSINYHVSSLLEKEKGATSLEEAKEKLIKYFENQLIIQYPKYKNEAPDNWLPLCFHLNGFVLESGEYVCVTSEIFIGKENVIRDQKSIGCTFGGEGEVVKQLWEIGKKDPKKQFKFELLTLQDAIDLSEFYISATSTFQRFANDIKTVGGNIDIALLTPFHNFRWIKRKRLMEILEEPHEWRS